MSTGFVEIQITCGSVEEADTIAGALVERRLAACVHQLPIRSTYRWQGAVERDDEILLLAKTTAGQVEPARALVHGLHSYDVPMFTVVEITDGSDEYLDWIRSETTAR